MPTKIVTFTGTPFGDIAGVAPALKWIPPKLDGIESLYFAPKYTAGTGIWREAKEVKNLLPVGTQANFPGVASPTYMNSVPCLYMKSGNTGSGGNATVDRTKPLVRLHTNTRKTASFFFTFSNQGTVPATDIRHVFTIASSTGNTLSFQSSGLNSKMSVIFNGTRTELAMTAASSLAYKVAMVYDNGTLKVYINGTLDANGTITGLTMADFAGNLSVGSDNAGANLTKFHGYFGFFESNVLACTAAEVAAMTTYMTNIFG